jgi:hypothetical protein
VRGGLELNAGKIEALVHWAAKKRLGVVAIQETMSLGEQERVMKDPLGEKWMLHTAGGGAQSVCMERVSWWGRASR